MSYAPASALQAAVFQHLATAPALSALIGGALYDQVPSGTVPGTYVTLGPGTAIPRRDASGSLTRHDFPISVVGDASGFQSLKEIAGVIADRLQDAPLELSDGQLVALDFRRARARRLRNGTLRQIDLWFRAQVQTD